MRHLALESSFFLTDDSTLVVEIEERGWRKFWTAAVGVEDYHNLVKLAVEARARTRGDVELHELLNEDVLYGVSFRVKPPSGDLGRAYEYVRQFQGEILEAAEAVRFGTEDLVAAAAKRLQGWGTAPLEVLVDRMREGSSDDKGRALEELTSRLFSTVPGFSATGRVSTQTEEIDIRIQNASDDPHWRRESYLLLAECKNWSGECGKDEFVLFKTKLENRVGRVSCGFLISWNGFTETVTKEMLRDSKSNLLVVPVDGRDLRGAVRGGDFPNRLKALHTDAIFL